MLGLKFEFFKIFLINEFLVTNLLLKRIFLKKIYIYIYIFSVELFSFKNNHSLQELKEFSFKTAFVILTVISI